MKDRYGLTMDEVRAMLLSQGHVCLICGDPIDERSHIDHDHDCCATKRTCGECIRGVLCGHCNKGMGHFKHSPEVLMHAALYLLMFQMNRKEGGISAS